MSALISPLNQKSMAKMKDLCFSWHHHCYRVFVVNIFKRLALILRGLVWQKTVGCLLYKRKFNDIRKCSSHHIFVSQSCRLLCCSTLESLGCVHCSLLVLRQSSGKLFTFPRGIERASILISHCHNSLTSELWLLIELSAVPYHNSSFGHKIIENILIWAWLHYLSQLASHSDTSFLRLFIDKNSIKVGKGRDIIIINSVGWH